MPERKPYNLSINPKLMEEFNKVCDDNYFDKLKILEKIIKEFIDKNKKK